MNIFATERLRHWTYASVRLLALLCGLAGAASAAEIVDLRVGAHAGFTRVVFELDRPAGYRIERVSPEPGVFELRVSIDASSIPREARTRNALIGRVQITPRGKGAVAEIPLAREGLGLTEMILASPPRIILDILAPSTTQSKPAVVLPVAKPPTSPKPAAKIEPKQAKAAAVIAPAAAPAETPEQDDGPYRLLGETTLGAHLYVIDKPFDTSNVTGFFDQYRYIRDRGAGLPYFLDLFHFDAGLARPDDTYLVRLERWSRNALNENGLFDLDWRGLEFDADYRRYRSDSLMFFPEGTEYDWLGTPATNSLGTQYHPFVPYDQFFDSNQRIYVTRQSVGGEISLRPEGFGWKVPVLDQLRTRARYEARTGYRQDSFLLDSFNESDYFNLTESFRGHRRKIDQSVASAGTTLVISPLNLFEGSLAFDFERFREEAPTVQLASLNVPLNGTPPPAPPGEERAFFFVPDTNRYTGALQLSRRQAGAHLNLGVFASYLEQTGRLSPLQQYYQLCQNRGRDCDNAITSVSAHADTSVPLTSRFDLRGWMKYLYRNSDGARQAMLAEAFAEFGDTGFQESPYIQERNELRGGLELGVRPARGLHLGVGYRVDWTRRDLIYSASPYIIQPRVSLINAESLEHEVFVKFRSRMFRSLQASAELGYLWAPEVAYPSDLSEAVFFRLRASYGFRRALPIPVSLSVTGNVMDGRNRNFLLPHSPPGAARSNDFERTTWGYDLTLTAVPSRRWLTFATFAQNRDSQSFAYIRTDFPRHWDSTSVSFYIDSIPHYRSDVKSLTLGGSLRDFHDFEAAVSASLTWLDVGAHGQADQGSNVGYLIDRANRIENRILTLESEVGYRLSRPLQIGLGYRYQQFVDSVQLDPIDFDENIHTITLRVTLDFGSAFAALRKTN